MGKPRQPYRTLPECVTLWKTEPAAFRAAYTCPVLLYAPLEEDDDDEDGREFHTQSVTDVKQLVQAARAQASVAAQLVIPITRRPNAIFKEFIGVGRAGNVDVCLPYAKVSKFHAYFSTSDDQWQVADAGSSNGTFLDKRRLAPKQPAPLQDRAVLSFGGHVFRFHTAAGFLELVQRM